MVYVIAAKKKKKKFIAAIYDEVCVYNRRKNTIHKVSHNKFWTKKVLYIFDKPS